MARRIAGPAALAAIAATVLGAALAAAPAAALHVTFPGANGKIAFELGNETAEHDIYTVNPDGSGALNLTHNGANNREIAWAPDGTRIAFFSDGDGSDNYFDIHVAGVDGSGAVRITNTGNASYPAWSPDGGLIAYDDDYLYTVRPDGTGLRALTTTRVAGHPAWSPDGSKIAFGSIDDARTRVDIHVVNRDGSGLRRLTDDLDQTNGEVSWSPDGTTIAYSTGRELGCGHAGCNRIYLMDADGTDKRKLTDTEGYFPNWAPDGSKIAFSIFSEGGPQIHTINPDGTGEATLTSSPQGSYDPTWSPDSTQLVFSRSHIPRPGLDVWVINRDGTGERYVTAGGNPRWQPLPTGKTAERLCKAERRRLGNKAFRARYGPARSSAAALRNCVARGGQ